MGNMEKKDVLIVVLIVLILSLLGYLTYEKFGNNQESNKPNNTEQKGEAESTDNNDNTTDNDEEEIVDDNDNTTVNEEEHNAATIAAKEKIKEEINLGEELSINNSIVKELYSWFTDVHACCFGFQFYFDNSDDNTLTFSELIPSEKILLIFNQLKLNDSLFFSTDDAPKTVIITSEQYFNAAKNIFGDDISYNNDLLDDWQSATDGVFIYGYNYKYNSEDNNYIGTKNEGWGCEGPGTTISYLYKAAKYDDKLVFYAKLGREFLETVGMLDRTGDFTFAEMENDEDTLDIYKYTFNENNEGDYYFYSVELMN